MYKACFVILHYLSFDATRECVDSILNNIPQSPEISYHIIIVDNLSPDDSYVRLQAEYDAHSDIHLLQAAENLGFAKGNNLGYRFALDKLHADFVIITNNDTEFHQPEFLKLMVQAYEQNHCALMGPDIFNTAGYHQNPYRPHLISRRELSRWIRNRRLWLLYLYVDKFLHLSEHIPYFEKLYQRRAAAGRPDDTWGRAQSDVVLQGACILFTPQFTNSFHEYAFYPETFLYCEEDILALLCSRNGLRIYYNPALQILHKESVSTNLSHNFLQDDSQSRREKDFFFTKNILASLKILKKLYKTTKSKS